MNDVGLKSVYRNIGSLLHDGVLDRRVIEALIGTDEFLAPESHLWDYKLSAGQESYEHCEVIKDILSFHNSYGGYLVLGVADSGGGECRIVGLTGEGFNEEKFRKLIKSYTGSLIEVVYKECPAIETASQPRIGLLMIPRREDGQQPVVFQKNAAVSPKGKQAFKEGQIYLRAGDESRPMIAKDDLAFLLGPRTPTGTIVDDLKVSLPLIWEPPLHNNLPDKNVICQQFVGRTETLDALWQWLADPFSNTRVLAGEGGTGKTSIAYTFATEFATRHPGNYLQVLWMSAKKRQFSALSNQYVAMPESHFSDVDTLLQSIVERCGATEEETAEANTSQLKSLCRESLTVLPALVVIDDVDSVEINEQKRIMELATFLAGSGSRFLLTTRVNMTASNDVCLTIPGLPRDEYEGLVESLCRRLKMPVLQPSWVNQLHQASAGSPLLTESIVRLIRVGMPMAKALEEWRGHAGQDARDAALDKEIQQLSPEARRTLLGMSYLGECSLAEIRLLTSYAQLKLTDAIAELQSLFLVSAPTVTADQPRFAVPELVRFLANEKRSALAADHKKLLVDAKQLRKGVSKSNSEVKAVGAAIGQASAQLAQGQLAGAIETLESALARNPNKPELQCFLARCFLKEMPPRINPARDLFKTAYEGGNRRPEVFDGWFSAEIMAGHWPGALHVASTVLQRNAADAEWRFRRASVQSQLANSRERSGDLSGSLALYETTAEDLKVSIAGSHGVSKQERIEGAAALNDLLWARTRGPSNRGNRVSFNMVFRAIKRGDFRRLMFERLFNSLEGHLRGIKVISPESAADLGIRGMLQQAEDAIAFRPRFNSDDAFRDAAAERVRKLDSDYRRKLA